MPLAETHTVTGVDKSTVPEAETHTVTGLGKNTVPVAETHCHKTDEG